MTSITAWPLFSHFGEAFGLSTHDCEIAQSACVRFNEANLVLPYPSDGFEPAKWPSRVRLHRVIKISKISIKYVYPLAAGADRGASATCR
jgi:hypothetical protein